MSEISNIVPFPQKPPLQEGWPIMVTISEDRSVAQRLVFNCEGVIHVFRTVPGDCQCGECHWDGTYK